MPPHLLSGRLQFKLEIAAAERDQFFQLLRVGGSKTMPHEMDAFVGGIETALTMYHQRSFLSPSLAAFLWAACGA